MKLYQVYAINPLGEKNVEFSTTDANEADDFFAQFEGACGWEFDYGVEGTTKGAWSNLRSFRGALCTK